MRDPYKELDGLNFVLRELEVGDAVNATKALDGKKREEIGPTGRREVGLLNWRWPV